MVSPRAREEIVRPQLRSGASVRPLNFTVRWQMKRGAFDQQVLNDLMAHVAKGPLALTLPGTALLDANRRGLLLQLLSYGEDAVASAVEKASDETIWSISKRGGQLMLSSGENIQRSLCLAAVELIEGNARPLARKRRRRAT